MKLMRFRNRGKNCGCIDLTYSVEVVVVVLAVLNWLQFVVHLNLQKNMTKTR